jgi:hyperosmotically inducible protein
MNIHKSHKIIVASGMAAVIGIGVVTFALRSDPDASAAQTTLPPSPVAETPATAPDAAAQISAAPDAVAQMPEAPAPVAHNDAVGTKSADTAAPSAVEPKLARNRHLPKTGTSDVVTNGAVARTGSAADTSDEPATEAAATDVDRVKGADEMTTTPATSSSPADEQKVAMSTELNASDSQITADVKSAIAGDSLSKDFNIGVMTIRGVVVLTGSLGSQDAIDHVKEVAGKVKGVKGVDTSALILASL